MQQPSQPEEDTKNTSYLEEVYPGVQMPSSALTEKAKTILSPDALKFICELHREFDDKRIQLLAERALRQKKFDQGDLPQYLDQNSEACSGSWKVAPIPSDLLKRRVEITGPVSSAKMVINMLSRTKDGSMADCAMLDFEDSMKPAWGNVVTGVENVIGAVNGTLEHIEPAKGDKPKRLYKLNPNDMPIVMVRCRGLHLFESNVIVDGSPISAGLLDIALCFFHTAKAYVAKGMTPKFYVPKCEHFLEARWWNQLFTSMENKLDLPVGTLRATFLIETLPAAFQMEEILFEFKEHAAGLNGGRWDKIFSDIKTLRTHEDRVMADRSWIDMSRPWMSNYALRLIEICHRRGAFAMGGMSAFTPGRTEEARKSQTEKVIADKALEASIGHDGCWVSHPYFIAPAMEQFVNDNQLARLTSLSSKCPELLPESIGPKTMAGLRKNVRVGIAYMHGWNNDIGCVSWDGLMEDLATLEISRAQVWQWVKNQVALDDGIVVDKSLVRMLFEEELDKIITELNPDDLDAWQLARQKCETLFLEDDFPEFFTESSEIAK